MVGQDPDRPPSPEEEQWLRAQLAFEWQQRLSVTLQRGNARAIITRSRRSRDGMGVRVYAPRGGADFDDGSGY